MAKGLRASTKRANKSLLRQNVFGPIEAAGKERLSAKLLELASKSSSAILADIKMVEDVHGEEGVAWKKTAESNDVAKPSTENSWMANSGSVWTRALCYLPSKDFPMMKKRISDAPAGTTAHLYTFSDAQTQEPPRDRLWSEKTKRALPTEEILSTLEGAAAFGK